MILTNIFLLCSVSIKVFSIICVLSRLWNSFKLAAKSQAEKKKSSKCSTRSANLEEWIKNWKKKKHESNETVAGMSNEMTGVDEKVLAAEIKEYTLPECLKCHTDLPPSLLQP